MSEDTPAGYIELEPDDPAPTPEPQAAAEPEPVEPVAEREVEPAPETDEDDEAEPADTLSDAGGRKYVSLSALREARERNKALKEQLAQPRGLSPEEQRQLDSARYIAQQLQNRPDIIEALQTGRQLTREQQRTVDRVEAVTSPTPIAPVAEFTPDELREVAELQGYYGADGAPDLKAAERYLGILDRRAAKLADQRVAPLIQREVNTASARQIAQAEQMAAEMGVEVDAVRPVLQELARANPGMMAESPEYSLAGVIFAEGMASLQAKAAARSKPATPAPAAQPAPRTEPLLVERSIGPAKTPTLTSADRARMQQYGVNPKALEHASSLIRKADGGTITFEED